MGVAPFQLGMVVQAGRTPVNRLALTGRSGVFCALNSSIVNVRTFVLVPISFFQPSVRAGRAGSRVQLGGA